MKKRKKALNKIKFKKPTLECMAKKYSWICLVNYQNKEMKET